MNIQFVGMKEFRQNMASYAEQAQKNKQQLIIMRKNKPIFTLSPIEPGQEGHTKFMQDIVEAREDVRKGKTHTLDEAEKMIGV